MDDAKDYRWFRDSLIVALADEVEPPGWGSLNLGSVCDRHAIVYQDTWLLMVPADLEKLGLGEAGEYSHQTYFTINGAGIARASEIREARRVKTPLEKLHSINWNTWVGLATLAGVLIALFALIA